MDLKQSLNFLARLKRNNNKAWFDKHKEEYLEIKSCFENLVGEISEGIGKFDEFTGCQDPKKCVFRIYKDVRFSKDKTPYKTHLGAYFAKGGKKSPFAGYYLHIEPKNSFVAGGLWMPEPDVLERVRQEIDYNAEEFMGILKDKTFRRLFKELEGEKLSRNPKNYSADHPHIEILKHKSFVVSSIIEDKIVLSKNFSSHCLKIFRTMKPLNDFLNRSIEVECSDAKDG
jgi:uncharacterized protein (TIGR02453 family)